MQKIYNKFNEKDLKLARYLTGINNNNKQTKVNAYV